jgi:hypothetical protein
MRRVAGVLLLGFLTISCGSERGAPPRDLGNSDDGPVIANDMFTACATGTFMAHQAPAAMLMVLDASGTMAMNGKYAAAQQAIVQAIDQPQFDDMALGLLAYPTFDITAPNCFGLQFKCGVSGLAQVQLAVAGTNKSNMAPGVRYDIYNKLTQISPTPGNGDGNPTYDALDKGITILKNYPLMGRRILFYITDGGASCASTSTRPGYTDGNGCPDWEEPPTIINLLTAAHNDATAPVNSVIVGVPGADGQGGNINEPPYHVRLALSAYAWAGSPETCDPACTGQTFTQSGADPSLACHFDMTTNYTPQVLANAITQIRGALLGCIFDLPTLDGGMVNMGEVNVQYTANGSTMSLFRRADPGNQCLTSGCWDYTSDGKVELFGKACQDVKTAADAEVQIIVGCDTVIM